MVFEHGSMRVVAKVPDEADLKVELEIGEEETEFEIELAWGAAGS